MNNFIVNISRAELLWYSVQYASCCCFCSSRASSISANWGKMSMCKTPRRLANLCRISVFLATYSGASWCLLSSWLPGVSAWAAMVESWLLTSRNHIKGEGWGGGHLSGYLHLSTNTNVDMDFNTLRDQRWTNDATYYLFITEKTILIE